MRFTSFMLLQRHWPMFGLRVRTPRLELRYPSDEEVAEIAERSVTEGVHDPAYMPFTIEWTDVPAPLQQRRSLQFHWGLRANWQPVAWTCNFAVFVDGRIVGTQSVEANDFDALRSVLTGSFLFLTEQGKGIGTEMRAAALHFAFAGLDAELAQTGAWEDNAQSLGVTRKLGYEMEGHRRLLSRGAPREMVGYRLTRATWETQRRDDITIEGLEPCLELFGVTPARRFIPSAAASCAGVDGCRGGWVVATRNGVRVEASVATVIDAFDVVGIDMPIGLPVDRSRAADIEARRYLRPRGSTVFPTPPRACIDARDYPEACAIAREATGKAISKQAWNIVAKINEVDRCLSTHDERRVAEMHPECSFLAMRNLDSNDAPPLASKHTLLGREQRTALIRRAFGTIPHVPRGAQLDDVLDAYAVLWSAERFARDDHFTLQGPTAERDARGLLMRIVV